MTVLQDNITIYFIAVKMTNTQSTKIQFTKKSYPTSANSARIKVFCYEFITVPYPVSPSPSGKSACWSSVVISVNAPVYGGSKKVVLGCGT